MSLNLTQTEYRDVHILSVKGELALDRGDAELPEAVVAALGAGARRLVLDLTRLAWLDSAGVGALVVCSKRAADAGAILRVAADPNGPVRRILAATHLTEVFDVLDDVESALRAFGV